MLWLIPYMAGAITILVTAFFGIRRLYHWWRPIRIDVGLQFSPKDGIFATVTNLTDEDQVLVECSALCAYRKSRRDVFQAFWKGPWTAAQFRLVHRVLWYAPFRFPLMADESAIRLPSKGQQKLSHILRWDHPLCIIAAPDIQIKARLSNGRTFRSQKIEVPKRWRFGPPRKSLADPSTPN